MLARLRGRSGWRHVLAALALLALALKILIPPGYMPGISLAQPIVLCSGGGPMPMMAADHGSHRDPSRAPHGDGDHPCAFTGLSGTALAADGDGPVVVRVLSRARPLAASAAAAAPGRGMAAPPPPSHAPPVFRA